MLRRLNCSVTVYIAFDSCSPSYCSILASSVIDSRMLHDKCISIATDDNDNDNDDDGRRFGRFGLSTEAFANLLILYAEYHFLCRSHTVEFARVDLHEACLPLCWAFPKICGYFMGYLEVSEISTVYLYSLFILETNTVQCQNQSS